MQLRQLAIEASKSAVVPEGLVFRWTAYHVKEIYAELLPRKYVLDGSEKVQVTCGPRGDEPVYHQVLGTSNVYVEDFDFETYAAGSPHEREETILRALEKGLTEAGNRGGADTTALTETSDSVRAAGFRLECPVKKLGQRARERRISVVRRLSSDDGECWTVQVRRAEELLGERPLVKCPRYVDMRDAFRRSALDGSDLVVSDRGGRVMASVSLAGLLGPT